MTTEAFTSWKYFYYHTDTAVYSIFQLSKLRALLISTKRIFLGKFFTGETSFVSSNGTHRDHNFICNFATVYAL